MGYLQQKHLQEMVIKMRNKNTFNLSKRAKEKMELFLTWLKRASCILMLTSSLASAIDNPDAPDLIASFETRESSLITAAENPDNGYRASLIAYTDYLDFLDKELNTVYQILQSKLPQEKQQQLKESQVNWLKYRDREFSFIENTWTKTDFGSSSGITRGQYKISIVRDRVIQLMHYAKAY